MQTFRETGGAFIFMWSGHGSDGVGLDAPPAEVNVALLLARTFVSARAHLVRYSLALPGTGPSGNQSRRQGKGLTELMTALSGTDQRGGSISHDNKRLILLPYIWSKPILILPGSLCTQPL